MMFAKAVRNHHHVWNDDVRWSTG